MNYDLISPLEEVVAQAVKRRLQESYEKRILEIIEKDAGIPTNFTISADPPPDPPIHLPEGEVTLRELIEAVELPKPAVSVKLSGGIVMRDIMEARAKLVEKGVCPKEIVMTQEAWDRLCSSPRFNVTGVPLDPRSLFGMKVIIRKGPPGSYMYLT